MPKVVIELEFGSSERNIQRVRERDVYKYLHDLMEDGLLDYTVIDGNETYGPGFNLPKETKNEPR